MWQSFDLSPCRGVSHTSRIGSIAGIRAASLLWSFCKNLFEKPQKFPDLRPRDDKWRQEPKSKIVGAINKKAALDNFGYKRCAFHGKLDADHQPFRADFADEVEL